MWNCRVCMYVLFTGTVCVQILYTHTHTHVYIWDMLSLWKIHLSLPSSFIPALSLPFYLSLSLSLPFYLSLSLSPLFFWYNSLSLCISFTLSFPSYFIPALSLSESLTHYTISSAVNASGLESGLIDVGLCRDTCCLQRVLNVFLFGHVSIGSLLSVL